jgi:hypothetical protein
MRLKVSWHGLLLLLNLCIRTCLYTYTYTYAYTCTCTYAHTCSMCPWHFSLLVLSGGLISMLTSLVAKIVRSRFGDHRFYKIQIEIARMQKTFEQT